MLDNQVRLGGLVQFVNVRPMKSWVNCTLKLRNGEHTFTLAVGGLSVGDRALERLQGLKDSAIVIMGRMDSFVLKAKPPDYPKDRTVFQLGMGKSAYFFARADHAAGVNVACFTCKVQKCKTDASGMTKALVKIRYARPPKKGSPPGTKGEYGTYLARVRFPQGFDSFAEDEEVFVMGPLATDDLGVILHAEQVVRRS